MDRLLLPGTRFSCKHIAEIDLDRIQSFSGPFLSKNDHFYGPKCLFETRYVNLIRLFYQLGARNNFNVASPYEPGETPWLTQDQQIATINSVKDQPPPSVYIRHQYFIDFNEFGEESPIYMNVIRDPIARFSSFYHFIRFGNKEGPV